MVDKCVSIIRTLPNLYQKYRQDFIYLLQSKNILEDFIYDYVFKLAEDKKTFHLETKLLLICVKGNTCMSNKPTLSVRLHYEFILLYMHNLNFSSQNTLFL